MCAAVLVSCRPPQGFFNSIHECQVLDFAGGMVVHMLGGLFGLVGAYMCGPRLGRFEMLGQDDDEEWEEEEQQQQQLGAAADEEIGENGSVLTNSGRANNGGELIDSASELAASNTPPSGDCPASAQYPDTAGDAAQPQPQQQLAASRSLHTLLPLQPVPAAGSASSSSRGAVLEMGQLGLGGTGKGVAGGDSTAAVQGAAAGSSNGGVQQPQLAASGGVHPRAQAGRAAAGQAAAAAASAGSSKWGWASKFGRQRQRQPQRAQQQQQRQRRRWPVRNNHGTSAGTCGSGICKFVPKAMPGHDMAFVTLGTFMLWFGWFGFNSGSVYLYVNTSPVASPGSIVGAISAEVVQRTSMNTALGGAAAGLSALLCAALFWGECGASYCLSCLQPV